MSGAAVRSALSTQFLGILTAGDDPDKPNLMALSGTSMATAVTSGVVAQVIEAKRQVALTAGHYVPLSPNAIKAVLESTAIPITDPRNECRPQ